ncbi:carboxylate-amine ligase [Ostreibacterium oceani]|uniref:Putative glutamate--cysteine ligase 2 n=1 Tax=Ostreibacterium oceani TaxID=2654998 RepID=A0A6N7EXK2_9GAMM|nr:carboxylate-amine ligase [Ostreibacterium oceani]MPV86315.1 carboxylate-amine ligase [Ostreibacterium oceani]
MNTSPPFTIGIEEEYLLVDSTSRALIKEMPAGFLAACEKALGDQVAPEFLQCQIEIGTRICQNAPAAKKELMQLRQTLIEIAKDYNISIVAASTHPFSMPGTLKHTEKTRYDQLAHDLQAVVRRLQISGMHVHCGIDDDDLRIDMMGQTAYILPHLLALSTSSPFWHGENTGLKSYRLAVWDEMPRTGLPERFDSYKEYQRHVDVLVHANVIEDASKIWWDIRPSANYKTLEMRISDVCTRIEDAICIAALYQCWLHMLFRLRKNNMRWRQYANMLINENRWRAQRYGIDKGLIDFGKTCEVPCTELIEEILALLAEDADILGCQTEITHARNILKNGTSAHRQVATYQAHIDAGDSEQAALIAVVDELITDTQHGLV